MQNSKNNALDAFLNLLTFVTLGWMSISFGQILFAIIDKLVERVGRNIYYYPSGDQFSWPIASILIITPIFLAVSGTLHRHYKQGKLEPNSGVYRWLTYAMLLITSLVIAGDLIGIINSLLGGEYTANALLKMLVVLVIALGIFLYYWADLKRSDYSKRDTLSQIAFGAIIIIALGSIIAGLIVADSPAIARAKKFDVQRVEELNDIYFGLEDYSYSKNDLPETLDETNYGAYTDPETSEPYEYSRIDSKNYELCATFMHKVDAKERADRFPGISERDWEIHDIGRQCYIVTVPDEDQRDHSVVLPKEATKVEVID